MTDDTLQRRFRALCLERIPLAGSGNTTTRLLRLMEVGREDLTLAKLVEAHWDAVSILAEAGREPFAGSTYGVWAAEIAGKPLRIESGLGGLTISGTKPFCSGSTLVDRALITVTGAGQELVDLDVRANYDAIRFDSSSWKTTAFAGTATAQAEFCSATVSEGQLVGPSGWYLSRPGFWHGAIGPAACWAGGAAGLVEYAKSQRRRDTHTLAHLGAMEAAVWAMQSWLTVAGCEIDRDPLHSGRAAVRALMVRHLIEQACSDILRRFARALGPAPLAGNEAVSRRYIELDLFLRQSHAERDLEALGRHITEM